MDGDNSRCVRYFRRAACANGLHRNKRQSPQKEVEIYYSNTTLIRTTENGLKKMQKPAK